MGTRNLTAVYIDGEYKVAQYGQWDGYPSGQGATIVEFLHSLNVTIPDLSALELFKSKVRQCSFLTEKEMEGATLDDYPQCDRDHGAGILDLILKSPNGLKLKNSLGFAGDSLMCEYAYVLDLDKGVLEVFEGFNKSPLADGERFNVKGLEESPNPTYRPVKFARSFPISELPGVDEFVNAFDEVEA